jgi:hypothetical protein
MELPPPQPSKKFRVSGCDSALPPVDERVSPVERETSLSYGNDGHRCCLQHGKLSDVARGMETAPFGFLVEVRTASSIRDGKTRRTRTCIATALGRSHRWPCLKCRGMPLPRYGAPPYCGRRLGESEDAPRASLCANSLLHMLESGFRIRELEYYAMGQDSIGKLIQAKGSNPGHLLFSKSIGRSRASAVTRQLISPYFVPGGAYGHSRAKRLLLIQEAIIADLFGRTITQ